MTISAILAKAASELKEVAERPQLEAEILLAHDLKKERIWLHAHGNDSCETKEFNSWIERRRQHEPVEYITGEAGFYGEMFHVNHGVLIPRPETELLVDQAALAIEKLQIENIVEIGVGSGVISIMLARKFPHLQIIATDINDKAIALAQKNAHYHQVENQISFVQTSLLDGITDKMEGIVSNPPYIADDFVLPENVRHEPENALFGGQAGDEMLKRIIDLSVEKDVKFLACEMGYDQRQRIDSYSKEKRLQKPRFYKDLAQIDRGFVIFL